MTLYLIVFVFFCFTHMEPNCLHSLASCFPIINTDLPYKLFKESHTSLFFKKWTNEEFSDDYTGLSLKIFNG